MMLKNICTLAIAGESSFALAKKWRLTVRFIYSESLLNLFEQILLALGKQFRTYDHTNEIDKAGRRDFVVSMGSL